MNANKHRFEGFLFSIFGMLMLFAGITIAEAVGGVPTTQSAQEQTGSIAADTQLNYTFEWLTPFSNTNYMVWPSITNSNGHMGNALRVSRIIKTTGGVTITVYNAQASSENIRVGVVAFQP